MSSVFEWRSRPGGLMRKEQRGAVTSARATASRERVERERQCNLGTIPHLTERADARVSGLRAPVDLHVMPTGGGR